MIWFRRVVAVFLALIFIIVFVTLLAVFRVDSTLGNPRFYVQQLRQADVYDFAYDDVMPAVVNEIDVGKDIDISALKPHIPGMIEATVPRDWLQMQVEQVIYHVFPYVLGDKQSFSVSIQVDDRVKAAAEAVKSTLHKEGVFSSIYDQAVERVLDEVTANMKELPPAISLSRDELKSIIRTVVPPEWALKQIDNALDQAVPYLAGEKDHFKIQVNVSERLDAVETVVVNILQKPETYDYLFRDVLTPEIKGKIKEASGKLPIGVTLTDDEILGALKQALPLDWYQKRIKEIVGQVFPYLKGTKQTLDIALPLTDRKPVVTQALAELTDRKLKGLVDSLPICTPSQLANLLSNPPVNSLPQCRPPGVSYAELKKLVGIDISQVIAPLVDTWIPDRLAFTEADLRQALGGDANRITQAKDWVQKGLVFTDEDLRANLGEDYQTLEDARERIAGGFTFTEKDLREQMKDGGEQQWQDFNDVRSNIGTARRWKMVVWIIPAVMLVGIGLLGGRRWSSKLIWAAAALAVAAIIALVIFGLLFPALAQPQIDAALKEGFSGLEGYRQLLADKAVSMVQNIINSFVGGIRVQALIVLVVAVVLIAVGAVWHIRTRKPKEQSREVAGGQK